MFVLKTIGQCMVTDIPKNKEPLPDRVKQWFCYKVYLLDQIRFISAPSARKRSSICW